MLNQLENYNEHQTKIAEYVIIGAGPAGICAIPNILNSGVSSRDIIWIDPQFKVGDFGTILSEGSSVPGNTSVQNYQKVYHEIYKMIPLCAPKKNQIFAIENLQPNCVCTLKVATEPMQNIINSLRKIVPSIAANVENILTSRSGLKLQIKLIDGTSKYLTTKRVIIATGAKPKTLKLPDPHHQIIMIDPNIAFIQTKLMEYLRNNPNISSVAVIGSSHSAALATMHLLKAGITVKQFMNKEYKYATPCIAPNGTHYTRYDNIGLKGDVAKFTRQLFEDIKLNTGEYKNKLNLYIGRDQQETNLLLQKHLFGCSHLVAAIGYEPTNTLRVNNQALTRLSHNKKTTEFVEVKGLFGIGVGFPQEVTAISGEIELAVGVCKFWATASNPNILEIWNTNIAANIQYQTEHLNLINVASNTFFFKKVTDQTQQFNPITAFRTPAKL